MLIQSAAAENDQGAQVAAMCASCHRLDGRDHGIPSIIGLDAKKLTDTMEAFRSGKRASQIMHVVARSLSDEEIAALADYLAVQQKESGAAMKSLDASRIRLPWRERRASRHSLRASARGQAKARVVVIGGGIGGATVAKYLAASAPGSR